LVRLLDELTLAGHRLFALAIELREVRSAALIEGAACRTQPLPHLLLDRAIRSG
jgi:hypothetical protein